MPQQDEETTFTSPSRRRASNQRGSGPHGLNPAWQTMNFGRYRGSLIGSLLINQPDYVNFLLSVSNPDGPLARQVPSIHDLIEIFDAKPYLKSCRGLDCSRSATRVSLYYRRFQPFYWCQQCRPTGQGAAGSKLEIIRSYRDALDYAKAGGGMARLRTEPAAKRKKLIRELAVAKGLRDPGGEREIREFFGG